MNKYTGSDVKHIDGIYKSPKRLRSPIQVELALDVPTNVKVKWSTTTKSAEKANTPQDKFYTVATAALTGTKVPRQSRLRLQRLRNSDADENSITIAQAVKRAKAVETKAEKSQDTATIQLSQKVSRVVVGSSRQLAKATKSLFAKAQSKLSAAKEAVSQRETKKMPQKITHSHLSSLVTIQLIIILVLGTALGATLYSYNQYKSNMNATLQVQQAQSEAKWQQLQASWQCISTKWNQMQTSTDVNKQTQGDTTC